MWSNHESKAIFHRTRMRSSFVETGGSNSGSGRGGFNEDFPLSWRRWSYLFGEKRGVLEWTAALKYSCANQTKQPNTSTGWVAWKWTDSWVISCNKTTTAASTGRRGRISCKDQRHSSSPHFNQLQQHSQPRPPLSTHSIKSNYWRFSSF